MKDDRGGHPSKLHIKPYYERRNLLLQPMPARFAERRWQARSLRGTPHQLETLDTVLPVLGEFHHATTEQLAALTQADPADVGGCLRVGHSRGIIRAHGPGHVDEVAEFPPVWSVASRSEVARWCRDRGLPPVVRGGGGHIRHDLLALDLALWVAETSPHIVALGGETEASPATWDPSVLTKGLRGDFTLWRRDGRAVVFEVTASRKPADLRRKLTRWAAYLAIARDRVKPLVVFVDVSDAHRPHRPNPNWLLQLVEDVVSDRKFPGKDGAYVTVGSADRAASGFAVTHWRDLFDERGPRVGSVKFEGVGVLRRPVWTNRDLQALLPKQLDPWDPPVSPRPPTPWTDDLALQVPASG